MEIVNTFNNPLSCDDCEFSTEKSEYTARHVALVHFKLESFLQNNELVAEKIAEYESTNKGVPKRQVNTSSPILPERKSLRTSKPTARFVSEQEQATMKCEQSQKRKAENSYNGGVNGSPSQPAKKAGKFDIKPEVGFGGFRDTGVKINPLTELLKQEAKPDEYTMEESISVDIVNYEEYDEASNTYQENMDEEIREDYEINGYVDDNEGNGQIVEEVTTDNSLSQDDVEKSSSSMSLLKKTLMKGSSPAEVIHADLIKSEPTSPAHNENQWNSVVKQRQNSTDSRQNNSTGIMSVPKVQVTAVSKSEMNSASMMKQLPPSISLTPTLPKAVPNSTIKNVSSNVNGGSSSRSNTSSTINPQMIAEANDSWAQSLLSKRSRSGSASSSTSPALEITKPGSVSFTAVSPKTVSPSVTLTPSQPAKQPVTSGIAKLIKLGSQKHLSPKPIGSVTLTPKGGTPAVSAQISRGSPVKSANKGSGNRGSVTLTPAGASAPSFEGIHTKGSVSLTPATPKSSPSIDGGSGGGSVVKIKRATQAKWQLKGPPGVSVTPVAKKSNNIQEVRASISYNSPKNYEHSNTSSPSVAVSNISQFKHGESNGEEQISNIHMSTSMQNIFNQDEPEREHDITDDEDMVHHMLLEPQVLLDTSTNDQVHTSFCKLNYQLSNQNHTLV